MKQYAIQAVGMTLLLTSLPIVAVAACNEYGPPFYDVKGYSFPSEGWAIELCMAVDCEVVQVSRTCGNIHYYSEEYTSEGTHWLFRVRTHEPGPDDDEYFVIRNKEPVSVSDVGVISCRSEERDGHCDGIDDILHKYASQ